MATIDVLCVVDTNGLIAANLPAGTIDKPTNLGSYQSSDAYVFMICDGQFVVNNQGKSELTLTAAVGDTIRWTITDPSTGMVTDQTAHSFSTILYGFSNNNYQGGSISQPVLSSLPAISYYNSLDSDTAPAAAAYMCSAWTSSVLTKGTVQYAWSFQVIDSVSGNVVGYYCWDPFIIIQ